MSVGSFRRDIGPRALSIVGEDPEPWFIDSRKVPAGRGRAGLSAVRRSFGDWHR